MNCFSIIGLYFNYDRFVRENVGNYTSKIVFSEVKVMVLRSNILLTYFYETPIINLKNRNNIKQTVANRIEELIGVNYQGILKIAELNVYNNYEERIKRKKNVSIVLVFLKSDQIKIRSHSGGSSPEFISLFDLGKVNLSDQSKEVIYFLSKWIEKECMNRSGLQKWFNSIFNEETLLIGIEYSAGHLNKEIKQKSTSLDTINFKFPRPQSANIELTNKKQADSLDQLSQKFDKKMIVKTGALKMALKSKISKTKSIPSTGPITAMPLNASIRRHLVIKNPLLNQQLSYHWQSDIVIQNPFWGKRKPDFSQIFTKAKSLINGKDNVYRNRLWHIDYPLHFASYRGDILHVTSLIDKGYICSEKDNVGWTPLHYAVWHGQKDVVALFIQTNFISANTRTTDLLTALHISIYKGNTEIAGMLIKQPDIDTTLQTLSGEDARSLSERLKQHSIINLLKSVVHKVGKMAVYLMDNSVRYVVLSKGLDTTFQNMKMQLINILNIPSNCVDVFSFWISFKSSKITGKSTIYPLQCFGDLSMTLKDLNLDDVKIYWNRNILLSINTEMKIKDISIISLLFDEAVHNFTTKSLYPCDSKDIILLGCVLLYLYLPMKIEKLAKISRRTSSLSRNNRPLSSMFSSNPDVSSQNLSSSMHTLKDSGLSSSTTGNVTLDKSLIIELRKRQVKQFLSNEKNLALIFPKKTKITKTNLVEDIFNQFMSSSFASKFYSVHDIKFRFLTLCWNLTLYGCAYFDVEVKLQSSVPFINCILAVNDMGVYILYSKTKTLIQNFKYSSISWNNSLETKCLILVTKKNNIYIKSKNNVIITQLMLKLHAMNPL